MEVINDLLNYNNMKIVQDTNMFCFSLDSVLLANFVSLNKKCSNILDIGCGNAPIPLILSTKTTSNIDGIEIQKEVYNLACKSVKINKLDSRINIINEDINKYYINCESDIYDVITCNPPFFKVNENSKLNDSTYKVFARHEVYLNLEQLFRISKKLLKNGGVISVVHRADRLIDIIYEMKKNNIEPKRVQFVYPKIGKECNMVLIEGKKNGGVGLKILPPLYVHDNDGEYSEDVKKYFEGGLNESEEL